jgi:histone arginine demethylase JMJD6
MFVPGAWWHAVLNLNATIAITENVCNEGNFERVWMLTRKGRKRLAYKWLHKLRRHCPEQFKKAVQLNLRDDWIMWVPHLSKDEKEKLNKDPYGTSSSSDDISSSTSSSSSATSDDEQTISMIRDGCGKLGNEGSEFFHVPGKPKMRYAMVVRLINRKIRDRLDR